MDSTQEKVTDESTVAVGTQTSSPIEQAPAVSVGEPAQSISQPFYKKYSTLIAIGFGVLIVLGAGYYAYATYYAKGGVVAIVNGKNIYQNEYSESITLIEKNAETQGADLTQESIKTEVRTQALDVLINNALLITGAEASGIKVTSEEVQAKYDELVTQVGSQEELEKRMGDLGLTEAKLRSNIEERIIADAYIESATDIEGLAVTEEEVNEFIKSISKEGTELPPLEEIRPQIEAQILSQKQQQIVTDLISKLRTEAKIDVRI